MGMLEEVLEAALIMTIRLGLPVIALFIIGYLMHRDGERRQSREGHHPDGRGPGATWDGQKRSGEG